MSKPKFNSMMLVSSQRDGAPTFRLIPLTQECPYGEVVYIPAAKVLAIFHKHAVEGLHMVPKIDDNGDMVNRTKGPSKDGNPYKQERKTLNSPQDSYIANPPEIDDFIAMFAVNPEFNYRVFMQDPAKPLIEKAEIPKLIVPQT